MKKWSECFFIVFCFLVVIGYFGAMYFIGTYAVQNLEICKFILQVVPRIVFLAVLFWPFHGEQQNGKEKYWPPILSILCISTNGGGQAKVFEILALLIVAIAIGVAPQIAF
jgi:hypothetical protein